MIQEIKIRNFLSIREEIRLSFEATSDSFAEDCQVVAVNDHVRLLRFMVLYGYNAAGKSNILSALKFLRWFWFYKSANPDDGTFVIPFKMDIHSRNKPSGFELIFFVDGVKYWYQLELDVNQVLQERLYFYKSVQPTKLFERTLEGNQSKIWFAPKVIKLSSTAKEQISLNCLKNMSFFAAKTQVNVEIPPIDAVIGYFKRNIMQVVEPTTNLMSYAKNRGFENPALIPYLLEFLKNADFNISDIRIEKNPYLAKDAEQLLKGKLIGEDFALDALNALFSHTVELGNKRGMYHFDERGESRGTLRTFGVESSIFEAMEKNCMLPIDEIESSLHPRLLETILFKYLETKSASQLLVTTHNDGLLDLTDDLLRKDSIVFVEKNKAACSSVYRLSDFRGLNRLSSIRSAYRNKRFGATQFGNT